MGRGRPITNRSNNLDPEAYKILMEAAQIASRRFRGQDAGDYVSIGWLRCVRKLSKTQPIPPRSVLMFGLLQGMRRFWATEWAKHRYEVPLSDHLEVLQQGVEEEPLTKMMANEYMAMLKPVERRLIRMRIWQDQTWDDIGAAFGISGTAARTRYDKIIAGLQRKVVV